ADRIFAGIGVSLRWAKAMPSASEGPAIEVRYIARAPGHPESIAFSTPFDPQPVITILYDRILLLTEAQHEFRQTLLAHALAHEIGHVLMGSNAHSSSGVMKANWTASEYAQMAHRPLSFLPNEADSIRRRLASSAACRMQRGGSDVAPGRRDRSPEARLPPL